MEFYDTARPLYLESDASGLSLGAKLLQVRDGMNGGYDRVPDNTTPCSIAFTSKSLLSTEWHYSTIKNEALGLLHWLENYYYCFTREACVITDHMPLVATLSVLPYCLSSCSSLCWEYTNTVCTSYTNLAQIICCRLAVLEQPYGEQGPGKYSDEHKC